jgi:hypothetical protein
MFASLGARSDRRRADFRPYAAARDYRADMPSEQQPTHPAAHPELDSGHLDEDPEALEDPVHSGDAKHQHDLHHHDDRQPDE